ncbi:uncharacterized protein LOC110695296 isoform X2 [Chenopodium quinoa]|uniref:uncharacterized protein LOC110695296 isoform X2 n=1 Tax=Chenopodium quinoa TaxID=63459 RepID=UPI000B76FC3B|nr:uncharacterized protein LOC110695296 isoform X2 [Chenopodium quinoa]
MAGKAAVENAASHPQENEAPHHPLQNNSKPGPKGAYEVKRLNNGLYIRVDMPGVPSADDVKVNNKSEKCCITFYGKAPKHEGWPLDDSQRVYAGSISLDRDTDSIPLEKTFKNGCLRLFLPGADGHLSFLTNQGTCTREMSFINPATLLGVRGVFETKFLQEKDGDGWGMYFRFDMPDFSAGRMCEVKVEKKCCIIFGPMGSKEYPLDERGRSYYCKLSLRCDCCCFVSETVARELRDGVMRMWFRILPKYKKNSSTKLSTSSSSRHVRRNSSLA